MTTKTLPARDASTSTRPAKHLATRLATTCEPVASRFGLPSGMRPTVARLPVPGVRGGAYFAVSAQTTTIIGHRLGGNADEAIAAINRALVGAR